MSGRSDIEYTGYEIVPELIELHNKNHPELETRQWDIVTDPPHKKFDLILNRHMLQHLKQTDALKVLENFSESRSKYLLSTTFPNTLVC